MNQRIQSPQIKVGDYFMSYCAFGKHLSQYLWIITASGTLNNAIVVATAAHVTQNPGACFVLDEAGFVSKGFILDLVFQM
jgi:hypothetical protein